VLTTLQAPVRTDLQVFLKEFGDALDKYGGAEGFQESFRTSGPAYRSTAEVNQALLGQQPGDLTGFVRNLDTVVQALDTNQTQLQASSPTSPRSRAPSPPTASRCSRRSSSCRRCWQSGRPALARAQPGTSRPCAPSLARRCRARAQRTGRSDYANPWVGQMRKLVSQNELRGLVNDLKPTIPDLAQLAQQTIPFFEQTRALSSCFNTWSFPGRRRTSRRPSNPAGPVYKETAYSLTGVAGESRSGDANGEYFRVMGGGGTNTIDPFPSLGLGNVTGVHPIPVQRLPAREAVVGQDAIPPGRAVRDAGAPRPAQHTSARLRRRRPAAQVRPSPRRK